jgi:hypothetical protein
VRIALAFLLVAGTIGLAVLSEPGSLLLALLVMLVVFLLGAARLAVDLVDLSAVELTADVALLVAVGIALSQIPRGNATLTEVLFVVGAASQALPRVAVSSRRSCGS